MQLSIPLSDKGDGDIGLKPAKDDALFFFLPLLLLLLRQTAFRKSFGGQSPSAVQVFLFDAENEKWGEKTPTYLKSPFFC